MNLISFKDNSTPGHPCYDWNPVLNNETFKAQYQNDFECADYEGVRVINWGNLKIDSRHNKARAGGVDPQNIENIKSTLSTGYLSSENPPIVMILPTGEYELWDGYNRHQACLALGVPNFVFLVYRLKEEWFERIDDAYDVVSLGSNLHIHGKSHTLADFINRGINYFNRNKNQATINNIRDWVYSIQHAFTKKQVDTIVRDVHLRTTVASNITPINSGLTAKLKAKELSQVENPLVICCKQDTYIERAFLDVMKNVVDGNLDLNQIVLYSKGCETAEEVVRQRERAIDRIDELVTLAERFSEVTKKLRSKGKNSYLIKGALPQILEREDESGLVELD